MVELQPIFRERSLWDGISDALRQHIVSGRLKPGQRLREQELCDELAVSRTALREAFPRLEVECLIISGREGRSVANIGPETIGPLRDTSIAMVSLILEGFCENAGEDSLTALRDAVDRTVPRSPAAGDRAFCAILGRDCGNRFAAEIGRQLENRREMIERFLIRQDERQPERRKHLKDLLAALERRDARQAVALRSGFLRNLFDRFEASLGSGQPSELPSSFQRLTAGR